MRSCSLARHSPLPFRLGATSYIFEAGLVENARRLRGAVDDMQLVLFRTREGQSNIPAPAEVEALARVAGDELTYSLHLPLFIRLTSRCEQVRMASLAEATGLLERLAPLPLSLIVAHLEGDEPALEDEEGWARWQQRARHSLRLLRRVAPVPVCVENIEQYPLEKALPLLNAVQQPLCIDIGHHMKMGQPVTSIVRDRLPRAGAVHLHGWDGVADHLPLTDQTLPPAVGEPLLQTIRAQRWDGLLTIELFSEEGFFDSRRWLLQQWQRLFPGG